MFEFAVVFEHDAANCKINLPPDVVIDDDISVTAVVDVVVVFAVTVTLVDCKKLLFVAGYNGICSYVNSVILALPFAAAQIASTRPTYPVGNS